MKKFKIDDKEYDLETISKQAKDHVLSLQAADAKLNELRRDTAITVTARNIYLKALKKELLKVSSDKA